jgi:sulfur relay (sulfurtransferase) DsrF/TusC family protein
VKQVATLIRTSPLNSALVSEALRMTLGLILTGNKVKVVFAENGVYLLKAVLPEMVGYSDIKRHMETLKEFGCEFLAEKESMEERGVAQSTFETLTEDRRKIAKVLGESDLVIGF